MNFAEFFSGVGLVREGLSLDGWVCDWANDISADKQEIYEKNFGGRDFILDDIWNIAENPDLVPNNIFMYTASFPCTDLSVAGGRAGLAGAESGTLNAFLKIVLNKKESNNQPKIVLLENVKGFLFSHKGKDLANTAKILSGLNYYIDVVEVDASFFTPQSRPRIFLIAVQEDLARNTMTIKENSSILDPWWTVFNEHPQLRSKKLKDIIKSNEDLNWGILDIPLPSRAEEKLHTILEHEIPENSPLWWNEDKKNKLFEQMSEIHKNTIIEAINKNQNFYGTIYRRTRKGKPMAEVRSDGVAGCLRAPRGGSSKQILIKAGFGEWSARLLTPREYARLQGVRDSFILPENANKGYFAMGDAVCVPVIQHLSRNAFLPIYENFLKTSV